MKKIIHTLLLLSLLAILSSCSPKLKLIDQARISTDETVIKTLRGQTIAKSGQIFNPPIQLKYAYKGPFNSKLLNVNDALKEGAIRVKVSTPYHSDDLYGVLLCSKVYDCSNQPTARSYEIAVSEEIVKNALNGRISCGYEYYQCGSKSYTTWVLWLSDIRI